MMKTLFTFLAFLAAVAYNSCHAFTLSTSFRKESALHVGYVPDGMTAAEWKKLQTREKKEKASKNFGAFGPQSFQSRSLQSFQKEMERGKADHLMPMFNAKEKLKNGKIKQEDIPYMQRGGSWDNSDVKTAKKVVWNDDDKRYHVNTKGQRPTKMDWSGTGPRKGGPAAQNKNKTAEANKKPPKKNFFSW